MSRVYLLVLALACSGCGPGEPRRAGPTTKAECFYLYAEYKAPGVSRRDDLVVQTLAEAKAFIASVSSESLVGVGVNSHSGFMCDVR